MSDRNSKRKVLLIGWDAADWEVITPMLEEGLMPSLDGLINRGVMGNLASLQPMLSPMLWNSVATGKFADKHGIHGFIEPDPVNGGARPYSSISRRCKALWNIMTESGLTSNVVGWWASHPAEPIRGNIVTNAFSSVAFDAAHGWRVPKGTIHPPEKISVLAPLKIFPSEISEAEIRTFIPDAALVDQQTDRRLVSFAKVLSDAASIHAVATALMQSEPWDFTAIYYDAVDHFSHAFMAYHPPRLGWIAEEEFEIYRDVVRGAYRFHDMMLETLLQLAGPETTVILCSDHGFESGAQRPRGTPREPAGPAVWHRQFGILVIAGPGIRKDERIYGSSLIDIAPTVLTLFDLPIGQDMDGRPLLEVFERTPQAKTIASWETTAGTAGMHSGAVEIDRDQAEELMQQFAALGYIENPNDDKEKQAESAEIEGKFNLACLHLWKGEAERALPLLEGIARRRSWEDRFLIQLANAYFGERYLRQAERLVFAIGDGAEPTILSLVLLMSRVKLARGDFVGCLKYLERAEMISACAPGLQTQIGDIYLQLLQWDNAHAAYEKALALDPDNAFALQGLSSVYRRKNLNEETIETALRAVSLLHRLPIAHFNLGVALSRLREPERARVAFESALRFRPEMINAHRFLATLHANNSGDEKAATFHRNEVRRLSQLRKGPPPTRMDRAERIFELPEIPPLAQRLEILLRERPDPKTDDKKSGKNFILVSGLPRSGTSLMMQMLEAGGVSILTDGERVADVDNPKGYYEWEPIKKIAMQPDLLDPEELDDCAIKCISMLIPSMPMKHNYKVIFMTRPIEEVARSQEKMLQRLGTKGAELDIANLHRSLTGHRNETRNWLSRAPHMEFFEIDYPTLVRDPSTTVARLVRFLGEDLIPFPKLMAAVVDASLYRKKQGSADS